MLNILKDLAGAIAVPTLVLYIVGFLCFAAYLGHFGFSTFDMSNPAYLIFGVSPTIGLVIAGGFAAFLSGHISGYRKTSWALTDWRPRFTVYIKMIFGMYMASWGYSFLLNLSYDNSVKVKPPSGQNTAVPDFAGRSLDFIIDHNADPYSISFNFLIIITGVILTGVAVISWVFAKGVAYRITARYRLLPEHSVLKWIWQRATLDGKVLIMAVDISMIILCFWLLFWSLKNLHHHIVDVSSFIEQSRISTGTVFAWIYTTVFALWIFSFQLTWPAEAAYFKVGTWIADPQVIPTIVFLLVVPVVTSIFAFGMVIFPRVPASIGGGSPRDVVVHLKKSEEPFTPISAYLIGEDSQSVFLINQQGTALQVGRSTISYMEVKK